MKNAIRRAAAALVLLLLPTSPAFAVLCDSTLDARYMDLAPASGTAACDRSGSTPPSEQSVYAGLGYTQLQESNASESGAFFSIGGVGATSGTFSVADPNLYDTYSDLIVVFKYGSAGAEPDWMGYGIADVFSADWAVFRTDSNSNQALSHVSLYYGDTTTVPAPGILALFGAGLLGLFAVGRRRQR